MEALVKANVASAGIADSFIKALYVTRTRHAHQVTASCLYILLKDSCRQYVELLESGQQPETFTTWCDRRRDESAQFQFWYTALHLELLVLTFVRSLRSTDFPLYRESLIQLAPWFFCLNHTNYA